MNFVCIKAIRKGTKPPIWRRAYVPLDITFTQMAYILESLLELPVSDFFEFEFYHEKDRLIEFHDDEQMKPSYEYSYVEASKTCVNDYLAVKKIWFTFRPGGNNKDLPQYRVECENIAKGISIDSKEVTYPVMIKQRSAADDPYWHDLYAVNDQLEKVCFLTEGKEEYPLFSAVCDRAGKGGGIHQMRWLPCLRHPHLVEGQFHLLQAPMQRKIPPQELHTAGVADPGKQA